MEMKEIDEKKSEIINSFIAQCQAEFAQARPDPPDYAGLMAVTVAASWVVLYSFTSAFVFALTLDPNAKQIAMRREKWQD